MLLREAEDVPSGWDIIYLFHAYVSAIPPNFPLQPDDTQWNNWVEPHVTDYLVKPRYSWTAIGYMVSRSGLEKLMSGDPLKNIKPVDVWLMLQARIVTDQPQEIVDLYSSRPKLHVLAAWPHLGRPRKMWTDTGHVSDTAFDNLSMDPAFSPRLATG